DEPGEDGRELATGGRYHRFIEQCEPTRNVSQPDQGQALNVACKDGEGLVAETGAGVRGCFGRLIHGVEIGGAEMSLRRAEMQIAPLDAIAFAFDEAFGPRQPAGGPAGFAERAQPETEPERGKGGPAVVALFEKVMMNALQCLEELVIPPAKA